MVTGISSNKSLIEQRPGWRADARRPPPSIMTAIVLLQTAAVVHQIGYCPIHQPMTLPLPAQSHHTGTLASLPHRCWDLGMCRRKKMVVQSDSATIAAPLLLTRCRQPLRSFPTPSASLALEPPNPHAPGRTPRSRSEVELVAHLCAAN